MDVAAELDVTPWEALIKSVRLAAGRSAWVDKQLEQAVRDGTTGANDGEEPAVDPRIRFWLTESRKERTLVARFAKAAVDAGVAERQVRNAELEGNLIAQVIGQVIDRLQLSPELRVRAFDEAHAALAAIEAPERGATTIEGTWTALLDGNPGADGREPPGGAQPPDAPRPDDEST
jgi:hypothetical protein